MTNATPQVDKPIRDKDGFTLQERLKLFTAAYAAIIDHPANSKSVKRFLESALDVFVEAAQYLRSKKAESKAD